MLMDAKKTIEKYCGNIRERLQVCRSRSVAVALKEQMCSELKFHCISDIVNNVLLNHIDKMINEIFDENGKNKLLEKRNDAK